jgi:hypothetical protein
MSDEDISIDEKRVYGAKTGRVDLAVATGMGVARVAVSGDKFGEFSLAHRCTARDVVAGPDALAVATDGDVLIGTFDALEGTDFGAAVAVGYHEEGLLAAGPDGRVARRADGEWGTVGEVDEPRAIDGGLLGAADGIYRVGDGLSHAGLSDVRDVAATGTPLAATGGGLYYLGPGWAKALEGSFETVDSAAERAHAATAAEFHERVDGEWYEREVPVDEPIAGVAYGEGTYAVTADGTVLADVGDGWRARNVGLREVAGLVVAPA